jgi:hypothetical protein
MTNEDVDTGEAELGQRGTSFSLPPSPFSLQSYLLMLLDNHIFSYYIKIKKEV